jgi:3(or 17)beta-hydroxysteroid dehydrogenase
MDRLLNKVALVTGAAKGLGEADARAFVREGARVILTDVDEDGGRRVAESLGAQAEFVRHDVRHEAEWIALMEHVRAKYGRLDVLVNNAGVVEVGTPESLDEASYRFVMAVSLDGTVWGCKHAIPLMRASGGGSIINMASITARLGHPPVAAYTAAKGAIEAYTRAVAVHCAQLGDGIRCNVLLPDMIDTPMVRSIGQKRAEHAPTAAAAAAPTARPVLGEPDDIAHLVVYLASDESKFVSGQAFLIDNTASVTKGVVPPRRTT